MFIRIIPKKSRYQLDLEIGKEYRESATTMTFTQFRAEWVKAHSPHKKKSKR